MRVGKRTGAAWLSLLRTRLERYNVTIEVGSPGAMSYLNRRGGEAVTVSDAEGSTILFRSEPSASAVLEEFAHVLQHARDDFSGLDFREMRDRREMTVKECLLRNSDHFEPEENAATRAHLQGVREHLDEFMGRW